MPVVAIESAEAFRMPRSGRVERQFAAEHWGVSELLLRDSDGNRFRVQAPLPDPSRTPV